MKTIIALFFALLTTPLAQAESSIETILALLCNDGEYIKFIVINTGKTNIEVTDIYCSYSGKKSDPEGKEFMEKLKNAKLGERFINPDYGVNITSFQASPIVLKPTEAVCLVKVRSDLNVTFKIGINGQLMTPKTIDVDMTKVFEDLTKKPAKAN